MGRRRWLGRLQDPSTTASRPRGGTPPGNGTSETIASPLDRLHTPAICRTGYPPEDRSERRDVRRPTRAVLKRAGPRDPRDRMTREFAEYRPYTTIGQFRAEIGKYVEDDVVAGYEAYVFVPIDPAHLDEDMLAQLSGVDGDKAAHRTPMPPRSSPPWPRWCRPIRRPLRRPTSPPAHESRRCRRPANLGSPADHLVPVGLRPLRRNGRRAADGRALLRPDPGDTVRAVCAGHGGPSHRLVARPAGGRP